MRVLFVGYLENVHAARWINQLHDQGWDLHFFPIGMPAGQVPHPELRDVTVHMRDIAFRRPPSVDESIRTVGGWPFPRRLPRTGWLTASALKAALSPLRRERAEELARTVRALRPDVVHSIEMQQAGYLTLDAKSRCTAFPPWVLTCWGNDLYLFGRLPAHAKRIRAVLTECDYYICECERDAELARVFGFRGKMLPRFPGPGGLAIDRLGQLRQSGRPSRRRLIVLKGYQHDRGRALVGLEAIRRCADVLGEYRVAVYSASPEVAFAAELLAHDTRMPIEVVSSWPHSAAHEDIVRLHGRARASIGLSISDGVSNSMLEAMAMGSLPIQSDNGCEREWVRDGENGLLVAAEDPEAVASALRRALSDDALVDRAAETNWDLVTQRLDQRVIRPEVIAAYERVAAQGVPRMSRARNLASGSEPEMARR